MQEEVEREHLEGMEVGSPVALLALLEGEVWVLSAPSAVSEGACQWALPTKYRFVPVARIRISQKLFPVKLVENPSK